MAASRLVIIKIRYRNGTRAVEAGRWRGREEAVSDSLVAPQALEGGETSRFVRGFVIGGTVSLLLWAAILALIFLN